MVVMSDFDQPNCPGIVPAELTIERMQLLRNRRKGRKGTKWTPELQEQVLDLYMEYGVVSRVARMLGCSPTVIKNHRDADPDFDEQMCDCEEAYADFVEEQMLNRAINGTQEKIVFQGKIMEDEHGHPLTVVKHSDRLMELAMKAQKPDKYSDKKQISGAGGGAFTVHVKSLVDMISEDDKSKGLNTDDTEELPNPDNDDDEIIEGEFSETDQGDQGGQPSDVGDSDVSEHEE